MPNKCGRCPQRLTIEMYTRITSPAKLHRHEASKPKQQGKRAPKAIQAALPPAFAEIASLKAIHVTHCVKLLANTESLKLLPAHVQLVKEKK